MIDMEEIMVQGGEDWATEAVGTGVRAPAIYLCGKEGKVPGFGTQSNQGASGMVNRSGSKEKRHQRHDWP